MKMNNMTCIKISTTWACSICFLRCEDRQADFNVNLYNKHKKENKNE